jgi:hypothetical protein
MSERTVRKLDAKPTIRQVYAIARALLKDADERWPQTREEASELIDRLRERDGERAEGAVLVTADRALAAAASRSVLLA